MSVAKMEVLRWIEQKYDERWERNEFIWKKIRVIFVEDMMRGNHLRWVLDV